MERAKFDIEKLQGEMKEIKDEVHEIEIEMKEFRDFKTSTIEKLITIFNQLKELQEGDKWIKRLIVGSLITGSLGAIFSFIVWAIQN